MFFCKMFFFLNSERYPCLRMLKDPVSKNIEDSHSGSCGDNGLLATRSVSKWRSSSFSNCWEFPYLRSFHGVSWITWSSCSCSPCCSCWGTAASDEKKLNGKDLNYLIRQILILLLNVYNFNKWFTTNIKWRESTI